MKGCWTQEYCFLLADAPRVRLAWIYHSCFLPLLKRKGKFTQSHWSPILSLAYLLIMSYLLFQIRNLSEKTNQWFSHSQELLDPRNIFICIYICIYIYICLLSILDAIQVFATISITDVQDFSIIPTGRSLGMILPLSQANGLVIFVKLLVVKWRCWKLPIGVEMSGFFWKVGDGVVCFLKGLKGNIW